MCKSGTTTRSEHICATLLLSHVHWTHKYTKVVRVLCVNRNLLTLYTDCCVFFFFVPFLLCSKTNSMSMLLSEDGDSCCSCCCRKLYTKAMLGSGFRRFFGLKFWIALVFEFTALHIQLPITDQILRFWWENSILIKEIGRKCSELQWSDASQFLWQNLRFT